MDNYHLINMIFTEVEGKSFEENFKYFVIARILGLAKYLRYSNSFYDGPPDVEAISFETPQNNEIIFHVPENPDAMGDFGDRINIFSCENEELLKEIDMNETFMGYPISYSYSSTSDMKTLGLALKKYLLVMDN